jgi:hypothetical protein
MKIVAVKSWSRVLWSVCVSETVCFVVHSDMSILVQFSLQIIMNPWSNVHSTTEADIDALPTRVCVLLYKNSSG